jgi:hypothetical protein
MGSIYLMDSWKVDHVCLDKKDLKTRDSHESCSVRDLLCDNFSQIVFQFKTIFYLAL